MSVKLKSSLSCFFLFLSILPLYAAPGDLLWRYKTESSFNDASSCVSNGVVYFGNYQAFYALNAINGSKLWSLKDISYIFTKPFVDKGRVFFADYDLQESYLRVHNAYNGEKIWTFFSKEGFFSPFVSNDIVYCGSADKAFYALNASDGSLKWKYQTDGIVITLPCIDVIEGTVFFGNIDFERSLFALDMLTGQKKWSYKSSGYLKNPCLSTTKEVVFSSGYTTTSGDVFALNAKTGEKIWLNSFRRSVTSPCFGNGKIYFCCRNFYCYAFDEGTGDTKWSYPVGSDSDPCYRDSIVYVGSFDSYIYALNSIDGTLEWKYKTGDVVDSSPCIEDGVVYCGSDDKYLYAIETYGYTGFKRSSNTTSNPIPSSLKAYPNPFRNTLSLDLPSQASVYSLTGTLIKTLPKGKNEIDTRSWKAGVYLSRCGKETKRVVKIE